MECRAKLALQPLLHTKAAVPGNAFEQWIDQADDQEGADQHGIEAGAFGNATTDDGGNGRGKGQQEEEFSQIETVIGNQGARAAHERLSICDAVAEEKIGHGRSGEIGDDLHQRIDLVFTADCAQLQKGKPGMHGQHHDGP